MGLDKTAYGAVSGFSPILDPLGNAVLNNKTAKIFFSKIDLMNKNGDATVLANPSSKVIDGEKTTFKSSLIKQLKDSYVSSASQIPNINTQQNIKNLIEAGVDFTIIPQIKNDNTIILNINNATAGNFEGLDQSLIRNNSISTKVLVKNNETLILAGMKSKKTIKETESNSLLNKIPFIRDIFKDESLKEEDIDLLFTITAKIMCE
jgi:type II secretory pathway component GspD/PulD (secretin)